MSKHRPDLGTIGLCAVLGSTMAGTTLGFLVTAAYIEYTDDLAEATMMLVAGVVGGAIVAACIGGPTGLVLGLIVSRWMGTSIAHAALVGALTGAAYPMIFLVGGLFMGANGLAGLTGSFALFIGLGAICGAIAHRIIVGTTAQ